MNLHQKIKQILENQDFSDEQSLFLKLKEELHFAESEFVEKAPTKNIKECTKSLLESFRNPQEHFVETGFYDLDKILYGGFPLGEFIVIGARPAMGKTAFITSLILHISQKTPTLLFSLEISEKQIVTRLISFLSEIYMGKIRRQDLTPEEVQNFFLATEKVNSLLLSINHSPQYSLPLFREECEKQIRENGVKVIFVDYLQLMAQSRKWSSRELEIGVICRELKNIATTFNVCVVVTSTLSRKCENKIGHKRPELSDLRESGSIEEFADKVLLLYRPEYYKIMEWDDYEGSSTENQAEVIIAKSTEGYVFENVRLNFNIGKFSNLSKETYEEIHNFTFLKKRLDELEDTDNEDCPF